MRKRLHGACSARIECMSSQGSNGIFIHNSAPLERHQGHHTNQNGIDWGNDGGVSVSLSLINSRIGGDSVCCDGCVSKLALCGNMSLMNGVLADEVQDLTRRIPYRENEISTREPGPQRREGIKDRGVRRRSTL